MLHSYYLIILLLRPYNNKSANFRNQTHTFSEIQCQGSCCQWQHTCQLQVTVADVQHTSARYPTYPCIHTRTHTHTHGFSYNLKHTFTTQLQSTLRWLTQRAINIVNYIPCLRGHSHTVPGVASQRNSCPLHIVNTDKIIKHSVATANTSKFAFSNFHILLLWS